MAIRNWNTTHGVWNVGTNWLEGVAPGAGDVAVINFTNAEPDLGNLGTLSDITINVVAGFKLDIANAAGPTTFDAGTSLNLLNSAPFVVADAGLFANDGYIGAVGGGEVDWYLIPGGVTPSLTNNGTLNIGAPFKVMGFGDFLNNGLLEVVNTSGTAGVGLTVMSPGQSLINDGTISVDGLSAPAGNTSAVFNAVNGSGTITLRDASITFNGDVPSTQSLGFLDDKGSLTLDLANHSFYAVMSGFRAGNSIDLGIAAADSLNFLPGSGGTPGVLTISNGGTPVASLLMQGSYTPADFALSLNGLSHEVLTTTAIPCFAAGTRLLTASGEVAVEALRVGDLLPTRLGRALAPVRWIGHRSVDCARHSGPEAVWPVRVAAGAIAPGLPHRDLLLSPDHALFLDGALVPVRYLVNGATIRQEPVPRVTYWHVELDAHDVVLAEGLPVETYLDTGNRGAFANAGTVADLSPDFARRMWEAAGCAPLLTGGPELVTLRARLYGRAVGLGHRLTADPAPVLVVDGAAIAPSPAAADLRFRLPPGARRAVLRSRAARAAEVLPAGGDARRLGLAVTALALDGIALALDDPRLGAGWHAPEAAWRWTDGAAEIEVAGHRDLAIRYAGVMRYWGAGCPGAAAAGGVPGAVAAPAGSAARTRLGRASTKGRR